MARFEKKESDLQEKVVFINRVAKVVKGGTRFSFSALVVVGDGKGNVGAGMGKAKEVPEAIRKGVADAKKNMVAVHLKNGTIPYAVTGICGAGRVFLKPAAEGTGQSDYQRFARSQTRGRYCGVARQIRRRIV